jgi:hypothetical protein
MASAAPVNSRPKRKVENQGHVDRVKAAIENADPATSDDWLTRMAAAGLNGFTLQLAVSIC